MSYFLESFHELLRELAGHFAELPPNERRAARKAELERLDAFSPEEIESILDEMDKEETLEPPAHD
jgi:hypothetical protein